MPEAVIDRLEVVQVDEHHGDQRAHPYGRTESVLHAVNEKGPVRKIGDRVVEGLVRELSSNTFRSLTSRLFRTIRGCARRPAD